MQDVSGFHCQASSLRIQWPLPSQALHVSANPNNPQQVSGKRQSRDWLWIPLLNGHAGFRADAPVVAQKTTSSWSLSQDFGFKQEFHIPRNSLYYNNASLVSNVLGDSRTRDLKKAILGAQKRQNPCRSLLHDWWLKFCGFLGVYFSEQGDVPKYFHDLHCRVSWDCRSA